jgi:hypothetical protein
MDRQAKKLANNRDDDSDGGSDVSGNSDSDFEHSKENGVSFPLYLPASASIVYCTGHAGHQMMYSVKLHSFLA